MPTVRVETNLSADFFPNDFMPLFLIFLAELLGKDKNVMKFVFDTDKNMTIVSTIYQKYLNFELAPVYMRGYSSTVFHIFQEHIMVLYKEPLMNVDFFFHFRDQKMLIIMTEISFGLILLHLLYSEIRIFVMR